MSEGWNTPAPNEVISEAPDFAGLNAQVEPDPMREPGAHVLKYPQEGAVTTIRIVLNDYSGADLVITNMTTLPYDQTSRGFGSAAMQDLLAWAKSKGMKDVRAVQVQSASEKFWTDNGFTKVEAPNPTNDFVFSY